MVGERWSPGDTGLTKEATPGTHIYVGAEEAGRLGLEAGVDGWAPFTVVPEEQTAPTITEFLLARIAEDEAAVERRGDIPHAIHRNDIIGTFRDGCADCLGLRGRARVLDESASKRAIIRDHAEMVHAVDRLSAALPGNLNQDPDALWRTATLRNLAAVYEHHQDYRKEWGNGG